MRALDLLGIQRFVISVKSDETYVLLVKAQEIDRFHDDEVLLRNACTVSLPHNDLQAALLPTFWKKFPTVWWVDLSNNKISTLTGKFPHALGSLNLSGNTISQSDLKALVATHILRLHIPTSASEIGSFSTINAMIASMLPNVWVVNDDFITFADRREATNSSSAADSSGAEATSTEVELPSNFQNERTRNLVRVIQNCPPKGKYSEYFRLEILLEEYLQEACYFNCFAQQILLQNNSSHRSVETMPVVDIYALMMLPHRCRLDLSVVLTACLMFHIPKNLLRDALVITMGQHLSADDIEQLYALPTFVKTAVVSLLRRVAAKEALEWSTIQQYCPKPRRAMDFLAQKQLYAKNAPPPLDYLDSGGFQFLRPVKEYLEQAIELTVTDTKVLHAMIPFSELELEILDKLPDVPTQSSAAAYFREKAAESSTGAAMNAASYKEWIPFAARHTVLLLTKSPSCPPLTRPQQSKVMQELYYEMLPILKAANMTMNDLDLKFVGPGKDGRMLNARTTTSGTSIKVKALDAATQSGKTGILSSTGTTKAMSSFGADMALMGGNALPFGAGLPKASPGGCLSWKIQEVPRNYHKAWNSAPPPRKDSAAYTDDLESEHTASGVFMTTADVPKRPNSTVLRTLSSISVTQYDIGAPAPLPRNRSFTTLTSPSMFEMPAETSAEGALQAYADQSPTRSPDRSVYTPQSEILSAEQKAKSLSMSVSVPTPSHLTPEPSVQISSEPTLEFGTGQVEAEASVFTHASSVESEPFGMLSAIEPSDLAAVPTFLPQRARSPGPYPPKAMQRPEFVSGTLAHPILGFSADANWSNKFLLAPPSAVAQSNFTIGRTDPANCWNFIEYAPVLVHSPAKRISQEALRTMAGMPPAESDFEVAIEQEGAGDGAAQTRPRSVGGTVKSLRKSKERAIPPTSSSAALLSASQDVSLQLLKEMGTIRNVRHLREQNERIAALSRGITHTTTSGEDASLSLVSQSQEPSLAGDEDSQWGDLDASDKIPGLTSGASKSPFFLTDVADQTAVAVNDREEEGEVTDSVLPEEPAAAEESWADAVPSSPSTRSASLPPRSYSQGDTRPTLTQLTSTSEFATTMNTDLNAVDAPAEHTGRHIPIPEELFENPLKELMRSVSTLEILMRKTNYSNIQINSQSVEAGKQGICNNVGATWYPLMAKNVYRLPVDVMDPGNLLGTGTVKLKAKGKKTPVQLKPLKPRVAAASSGKFTDSMASVEEPAASMQRSATVYGETVEATSSTSGSARELAADLSNSAYFKSLFKSRSAAKKSSAWIAPPRILPKMRTSVTPFVFPEEMRQVLEQESAQFTDDLPRTASTEAETDPSRQVSWIAETSSLEPGEVTDLFASELNASLTSSSPLMMQLKEGVHELLLSHPATPRGESVAHIIPLTPPPMSASTTIPRSQSPVYKLSADEPTGRHSPVERTLLMTIAGKNMLALPVPAKTETDELSVSLSVGSALSKRSAVSQTKRTGGEQRILNAYAAKINKSLDWDNFTDSSSVVAGADHSHNGGRARAATDAAGRPSRRSAPSSTGMGVSASTSQLKLAPTITSAVVPAVIAGQQIPTAVRASTGLGNGPKGGLRRANKSGTSTPALLTGD